MSPLSPEKLVEWKEHLDLFLQVDTIVLTSPNRKKKKDKKKTGKKSPGAQVPGDKK